MLLLYYRKVKVMKLIAGMAQGLRELHKSLFNSQGDVYLCVYEYVCFKASNSAHCWRVSVSDPVPQSAVASPRPSVLSNNGKGNGLPKASSFSLIALPASSQPCHKTISSIYQPYIRYVWKRGMKVRAQRGRKGLPMLKTCVTSGGGWDW